MHCGPWGACVIHGTDNALCSVIGCTDDVGETRSCVKIPSSAVDGSRDGDRHSSGGVVEAQTKRLYIVCDRQHVGVSKDAEANEHTNKVAIEFDDEINCSRPAIL